MKIKHILTVSALVVLCNGCTQKAQFSESEIFERSDEQIELQYGMARMLERKKLFKEARESYLELLDSKSDYGPALHRLGVVSIRLDDVKNGIEYFERAVEHSDESADLLADYGYALFLAGDTAGAKMRLRNARELDPSNQRVINNLAIIVGSEGNIDKALDMFRLVNSEANALCNVGFVLSQNEDMKQAKQYFHRALDLNPKLKKAANGLIQIHQHEQSLDVGSEVKPEKTVESRLDEPKATVARSEPKLVELKKPPARESYVERAQRGDVLKIVREATKNQRSKMTRGIMEEDAAVAVLDESDADEN